MPSGIKPIKQLPIEQVDELADELVRAYGNPVFRVWYCGVIYEFGLAKVHEWKGRAAEGKEPGKLFSKYVQDARRYRKGERSDT